VCCLSVRLYSLVQRVRRRRSGKLVAARVAVQGARPRGGSTRPPAAKTAGRSGWPRAAG